VAGAGVMNGVADTRRGGGSEPGAEGFDGRVSDDESRPRLVSRPPLCQRPRGRLAVRVAAVVLIGLFGVAPIVWALIHLVSEQLADDQRYVGRTGQLPSLLHDPMFAASVRRTVVYTVLFVPITLFGALAVAVALNRRLHGMRFYRTRSSRQ